MLQRFLRSLQNTLTRKSNQVFLVATSGGIDSVVLCHLFSLAKLPFAIAHCNFQLRGKESDEDEVFVRKLSQRYNVPIHYTKFDTEQEQQNSGESIQMVARSLRYNWFEEVLDQHSDYTLCTAHHLNDNIETVLLNIARGTTIKGLSGIAPQGDRLLRPLLFATKDEIKLFAESEQLTWREDSSNAVNKYKRNRVRNEIIEQFQELNPSFSTTFGNNIERWKLLASHIKAQVHQFDIQFKDGNNWVVPAIYYQEESNQVVVLEWLKEKGFSENQFHELLNVSLTGKQWEADQYLMVYDRERVLVAAKEEEQPFEITIEEGQTEVNFPGGKLSLAIISKPEKLSQPSSVALLNPDKLSFPLILRPWQLGDKFQPFGMRGTKKVSDFFVDQKIPVHEKNKVLVLLSGNEVCWVVGMRIDERFRVEGELIFKIVLH